VFVSLFRELDSGKVLIEEEEKDVGLQLVEGENARYEVMYFYSFYLAW
jgi:hypothetical protein